MSGNTERDVSKHCPFCESVEIRYDGFGTDFYHAIQILILETIFICEVCGKSFTITEMIHHENNDVITWEWSW